MGNIKNRRRTPRRSAGWVARYALDDRPQDGWYECRILDASLGGAALELFGPVPVEEAGLRVQLQASSADATGLQLRARMRNLGSSNDSGIRVGVEWRELTPLERELLALLLEQQPATAS